MLIDIKVIKNHEPVLNVNYLKCPIMYVEIIDVYHFSYKFAFYYYTLIRVLYSTCAFYLQTITIAMRPTISINKWVVSLSHSHHKNTQA